MDWKKETLDYYDQNAETFVSGTLSADMENTRSRFSAHLPPKGIILDFGCGSGRDTKAFLDAGFRVDAVDGSGELCALASAYFSMNWMHVSGTMGSGPARPFCTSRG